MVPPKCTFFVFFAQNAFWYAFSHRGTLVYVFIEYKYMSVLYMILAPQLLQYIMALSFGLTRKGRNRLTPKLDVADEFGK